MLIPVELPAAGKIDLHCHLLAGVDDGCRTLDQSVECIRQWMKQGFSGSICTPHVGVSFYSDNTPENLQTNLRELRERLAEENLPYAIWDGGEVRLSKSIVEWFSFVGLPTLGPGRCVLLDWWGRDWPDYCTDACQFLVDNGYQPVLAHPERMGLTDGKLDDVLAELTSIGVWLQGNLNSIGGGEGPVAQQRAEQLLRKDGYHVLASDTHGPDSVISRVYGLKSLLDHYGEDKAKLLLEQRPREILLHGREP